MTEDMNDLEALRKVAEEARGRLVEIAEHLEGYPAQHPIGDAFYAHKNDCHELAADLRALLSELEAVKGERDAAYADLETLREWTMTHGGTHAENVMLKGRLREAEAALAVLKGNEP